MPRFDFGRLAEGTVTRTLRLDRSLNETIEELAAKEGVTVNVLASQVLRKYATWDFHADQFRFINISKDLYARLLARLSEEEARELGKSFGANETVELATFLFKSFTFENLIKSAELLSKYGREFGLEYSYDSGLHILILRHGMGIRMSQYRAEVWKTLFARLKLSCQIEETEGMIMITVPEKARGYVGEALDLKESLLRSED